MSNADSDDLNVNMFIKHNKKSNIKKTSNSFDKKIESENQSKTSINASNEKNNAKKLVIPVKNIRFKNEQDELFKKVKNLIKLTESNSFLSTTIIENNEKITGEIFADLKMYHHSKMWSQLSANGTQSSMSVIRKIFMFHGFEIISKEFRSGDVRGYKYYVVPLEKETNI
jgi:hypothetical protein